MRFFKQRRSFSSLWSFASMGIARRFGRAAHGGSTRHRSRQSFSAWRLASEPLEGRAMMALTIGPVTDSVAPITGVVTNGGTTNDNDLTVTVNGLGAYTAPFTVELYDGVTLLASKAITAVASSTTIQTGTLPDSTISLTAKVDADTSGPFAATIDTTAPTAPVVTPLTTNSTTPTITGTTGTGAALNPAESLTVTIAGQVFNPTPDPSGNWSVGPLAALAPNQAYDVTATVTDAAGNFTTDSTTGELTIDTTAPLVTGITGPANLSYLPGSRLIFTLATQPVAFPLAGAPPTIDFDFPGGNTRTATYEPLLSSATSLVFSYVIQSAPVDTNANFIENFVFTANGAADTAGNTLLYGSHLSLARDPASGAD